MTSWTRFGIAAACVGQVGCAGGLIKSAQPTMTLSEAICQVQNSLIETSRGQDQARAGMKLAKATVTLQLGVKDSAEASVDAGLAKGIVTWGPSAKRAKEATTNNTLTIEFQPVASSQNGENDDRVYIHKAGDGEWVVLKSKQLSDELAVQEPAKAKSGSSEASAPSKVLEPVNCGTFALGAKGAIR